MGSNNVNSLTYNSYGKLIIDNKTIFDYSSVNVTSNDVKSGLKYVDKTGGIITGTMPSIGNKTYTPTTTEQILPVNTLIGPNVKVAGDQNLISSKILEDASIFGVQGNAPNIPIENWAVNGYYAICIGSGSLASIFTDTSIVGVIFRNCTQTTATSAFSGASNLRYIYGTLPAMANTYRMFYGCTSLTNADFLTNSLGYVHQMFLNCTKLATIDYMPNITNTNNCTTMFTNCTALTTFNTVNCPGPTFNMITSQVKSSVKTIKNYVNVNLQSCCRGFTALSTFGGFSGAATSATDGSYAFYGCTTINSATQNINLPSTVTNGFYAYGSTTHIHDVTLPANLTNGGQMFQSATGLRNVRGSASKLTNAYYMFRLCNNLNIDTLPASLTDTNRIFYNTTGTLNIGNFFCSTVFNRTGNFATIIRNVNVFRNAYGQDDAGAGIFQSTQVQNVNHIENLNNGYRMFYGTSTINYVNFIGSRTTLTNLSQTFYDSTAKNIAGFNENNKVNFTSLVNCYQTFRSFNGAYCNTIRISSSAAGAMNFQHAFYLSTGVKKIIINTPNSSSIDLIGAFRNCTSLTDLYLNVKVAPTSNTLTYVNRGSARLNIYIPAGGAINTAYYSSGKATTTYFPQAMNWTLNSDGSYYNATYNYYIYPTLNSSSTI